MMHEKEDCRLCNTLSPIFHITEDRYYFKCPNCDGIFISKQFLPDESVEFDRYEKHDNDVFDPKYREFVSPITNKVQTTFSNNQKGLDFGSGPGPVITTVLREKGYTVETYDPYFDDRSEVLKTKYDYVFCCEVVEHFHDPSREFQKLQSLVKPNGSLLIMTNQYTSEIDFENWYYRRDPTHVFFYQKSTFYWIKETFRFKSLEFQDRLTILDK